MQKSGDVQTSLARELAEYEMQVERDVLAPMTSLLEVNKCFNNIQLLNHMWCSMCTHCMVIYSKYTMCPSEVKEQNL